MLGQKDKYFHLKNSQTLIQKIVNVLSAMNPTARMEKNGLSVHAVGGYMSTAWRTSLSTKVKNCVH